MRTLLYVINQAETFFSHRLPWARAARDAGWAVLVAGPVDGVADALQREGFHPRPMAFVRGTAGPRKQLTVVRSAVDAFRSANADVIHLVGTQVVATLGPVARTTTRAGLVASVTGLGHAFLTEGLRGAAMRAITFAGYAATTAGSHRVRFVFQNRDDIQRVTRTRVLRDLQPMLIRGSGVDVDHFLPEPEPPEPCVVMLASRLLREKGVLEFVAAARLARTRAPGVRFVLVGAVDPNNPSSFAETEVRRWTAENWVEWWGHSTDIRASLASAHVVVLPSWREGLPKVLLEAAAMGKPLIATDVPGCREVVEHGRNGYLTPLRDPNALAQRAIELASDRALRARMGTESRALAQGEFAARSVSMRYVELYEAVSR